MKRTKNIILFSVALMTFIIFFVNVAFSIYDQQTDAIYLKESLLVNSVVEEAEALNNQISMVSQNARVLALLIENDATYNTTLYEKFIEETLLDQKMVFGMGYWFEPYKYDAELLYYAPYLYKNSEGHVVKTMSYSTEAYDYPSWDWYNDSIMSEELTIFSPPYYDEILDTVFMTGAVKVLNNEEQIGVVSIDITLREVNAYLEKLNDANNGDAFIVTEEGFFWGNAENQSNDLKDNVKTTEDLELRKLSSTLLNSKDLNSLTLAENIYVWAPVGDTGLKLIVEYPKQKLLSSVYESILSNLLFFIIAMIVFILLLNLILVRRIEKPLINIISSNISIQPEGYAQNIHKEESVPDFDQMIQFIYRLLAERQQHILDLNQYNVDLKSKKEEIETLYNQTTAMNKTLQQLLDEVQDGYIITVRSLSNAIEAKDTYTKGHCESVTLYAMQTAEILGLSEEDLRILEYSALLHDVGKIGIPSSILNKPSKLTDEEFDVIKSHPAIGYEILKDIDFLRRSALIIYQHHERLDGKGYPRGIVGAELDILTRIITVTDAYDAMTSARPYRLQPLSHEKAMSILREGCDTQFDSKVIEAFATVVEKQQS